ncbi:MAG: ATP-binding protein [Pseudomonadota bacterium]
MTELSLLPNPFRENVVQDAWQTPLDISEIHAAAFEACRTGIESAARGVPDSLLIYGAAGSGKTHLLSRLQRHLAETARSAPDNVLRCVFSFVRLQTSPQLLWQHVRRRLVTDLMRREQGLTQLQRLVAHQLGIVAGRGPRAGILELRVLRSEDQPALAQHLQELAMKLDLPRNLCVVLEQLIFNRNVHDAAAWLAGDSLPESVLAELGLGVDIEEDREEAGRHLVTALCRLAGETLPIVFCFDQVESLQRTANDEEALFRFSRMAADLHDADANVFLITCLQVSFLDQFKRAVRTADYDRIARRSVSLESLNLAQIESLLRSRLDHLPQLRSIRTEHPDEPFYPLRTKFVQELALESPCVPRRILALAARAFEERQHGRSAPVATTAQFLGGELETRQREALAGLEPSDTHRIMVQGAELIAHLEGAKITDSDPERADVVISGPRGAAISLLNEADGRSLTPKLKALLAHAPRKDGTKQVIIRDARLPIAKTAVKAREYLSALQARGVLLIEPTVEALAALEALASILGDAKSGDLASEDTPLEAGAVLTWIKSLRMNLGIEPVEELIESLFSEVSIVVDSDAQDLADLLSHEHVISVEVAAQLLGRPPSRVLDLGHKASAHCLVLEGPPAVLLDISGVAPELEVVS